MPSKVSLLNETFGRLEVVAEAGRTKRGEVMWRCLCTGSECGSREVIVRGRDLRNGKTLSCGCWNREASAARRRTHGQTGTPLYEVWKGMKQRCYNRNHDAYPYYGGRGITVCVEWRESFEVFERDMGPTYRKGLSIERREVDGPYAPWNCTWATDQEQANNRSSSRIVTFRGQTKSLSEWCELLGMNRRTVASRLDRSHWSIERSLTEGVEPAHLEAVMAECHGDFVPADSLRSYVTDGQKITDKYRNS